MPLAVATPSTIASALPTVALILLHFGMAFLSLFLQWQQLYGPAGLLPLSQQKLLDALSRSIARTLRVKDGAAWLESLRRGCMAVVVWPFGAPWLPQGVQSIAAAVTDPAGMTDGAVHAGIDALLLAMTAVLCLVPAAMLLSLLLRQGTTTTRWYPLLLLAVAGGVLVISTVVYDAVVSVGEVFMAFQWDIMLNEAGYLTALVAMSALWMRGRLCGQHVFLFRVLLFKLLFLSGVVKLQSGCKTWWDLSAGFYHHTTQCLPTPAAYYFAQLPFFFHQFSIAAVLFQQTFLSLLLVTPSDRLARFALVHVVLEQVPILLSGNYCFFNTLTLAVAFGARYPAFEPLQLVPFRYLPWPRVLRLRCPRLVEFCVFSAGLLALFLQLFEVSFDPYHSPDWGTVRIVGFSRGTILPFGLPAVLALVSLSGAYAGLLDVVRGVLEAITGVMACWRTHRVMPRSARAGIRLSVGVVHAAVVGAIQCAMPVLFYVLVTTSLLANHTEVMENAVSGSDRGGGRGSPPAPIFTNAQLLGLPALLQQVHRQAVAPAQALLVASGGKRLQALQRHIRTSSAGYVHAYGLFRHMTGVGAATGPGGRATIARPELILEARNSARSIETTHGTLQRGSWHAYAFLYKPGNVTEAPRWNIPHQPRLDWHMWFAALSPEVPHWLLHLLTTLMTTPVYPNAASRAAAAHQLQPPPPALVQQSVLVGRETSLQEMLRFNPFGHGRGELPDEVRLVVYHYNFTAWPGLRSPRASPRGTAAPDDVKLGTRAQPAAGTHEGDPSLRWWQRVRVKELLCVRLDDPRLDSFVRQTGFALTDADVQALEAGDRPGTAAGARGRRDASTFAEAVRHFLHACFVAM